VDRLAHELGANPAGLTVPEIYDYWEGKLDSQGRASVEKRAASDPFAFHLFSLIGTMVGAAESQPAPEELESDMEKETAMTREEILGAIAATLEARGFDVEVDPNPLCWSPLTLNGTPVPLSLRQTPSGRWSATLDLSDLGVPISGGVGNIPKHGAQQCPPPPSRVPIAWGLGNIPKLVERIVSRILEEEPRLHAAGDEKEKELELLLKQFLEELALEKLAKARDAQRTSPQGGNP
jgi:hypothetical protein